MGTPETERDHLFARVVDVSPDRIYLEVEEQIRFRAAYRCPHTGQYPTRDDLVEFHFAWQAGHPCVAIDAIVSASSLDHNDLHVTP